MTRVKITYPRSVRLAALVAAVVVAFFAGAGALGYVASHGVAEVIRFERRTTIAAGCVCRDSTTASEFFTCVAFVQGQVRAGRVPLAAVERLCAYPIAPRMSRVG